MNTVQLSLSGYRYAYRRSGNWESGLNPIFFLSGAFQSMESWRKFEKYFCLRGHPILLADLPGAGQADVLPERFGVDFLSEALGQVVEDCGAAQVRFVAASYGTPIAYHYTQRCPERVERMVLAGTMKEIPAHLRGAVKHSLELMEAGDMHRFAMHGIEKGLLCRDNRKNVQRRRLAERVLYRSMSSMNLHSLRQYAANTRRLFHPDVVNLRTTHRVPSLVFTGEHDTFTQPMRCREVARSLHRSWYTLIENADHLFHLEQFETTASLIERFVDGKSLTGLAGIGPVEFTGRCQSPSGNQREPVPAAS